MGSTTLKDTWCCRSWWLFLAHRQWVPWDNYIHTFILIFLRQFLWTLIEPAIIPGMFSILELGICAAVIYEDLQPSREQNVPSTMCCSINHKTTSRLHTLVYHVHEGQTLAIKTL